MLKNEDLKDPNKDSNYIIIHIRKTSRGPSDIHQVNSNGLQSHVTNQEGVFCNIIVIVHLAMSQNDLTFYKLSTLN